MITKDNLCKFEIKLYKSKSVGLKVKQASSLKKAIRMRSRNDFNIEKKMRKSKGKTILLNSFKTVLCKEEDKKINRFRKIKVELLKQKRALRTNRALKKELNIIYDNRRRCKTKNSVNDVEMQLMPIQIPVKHRIYKEHSSTQTMPVLTRKTPEKKKKKRAQSKIFNGSANKFKNKLTKLFSNNRRKIQNLKTTTLGKDSNCLPYNKYLLQRIEQFKKNEKELRETKIFSKMQIKLPKKR